jgi:hypothetical protein
MQMSPAQEQFARVKRYLVRMERKASSDEGTDDVYSFFLHAWHLVDWAGNDPAVGSIDKLRAEAKQDFSHSIWLCRDIAEGTKHLVLTDRTAPQITGKDIRMFAGANRSAEASFTFTFPDGSKRDALTLAREVFADWEQLLKRYGLFPSAT